MAFVPFVETDQPTMAAFNEKFQSLLGEGVQIEKTSRTGKGTYGSSHPSFARFTIIPDIVIMAYEVTTLNEFVMYFGSVEESLGQYVMYADCLSSQSYTKRVGFCNGAAASTCYGKKSVDGDFFYWYANSAKAQFNELDHVYHLIGIKF